VHHPGLDAALVEQTLKVFYEIRVMRLRKRPSTSELIDWIAVLKRAGVTEVKLDKSCLSSARCSRRSKTSRAFADQLAGGRKFRS
jgi:MoxR-like ATPase